jgi:hypothetical protein
MHSDQRILCQSIHIVTSTALPGDFYFIKLTQPYTYFFKLTQPFTYFYRSVTVREKRGKPDRKPCTLPYVLRNPYRNLKSENPQYMPRTETSTKLYVHEFGLWRNENAGEFCQQFWWRRVGEGRGWAGGVNKAHQY